MSIFSKKTKTSIEVSDVMQKPISTDKMSVPQISSETYAAKIERQAQFCKTQISMQRDEKYAAIEKTIQSMFDKFLNDVSRTDSSAWNVKMNAFQEKLNALENQVVEPLKASVNQFIRNNTPAVREQMEDFSRNLGKSINDLDDFSAKLQERLNSDKESLDAVFQQIANVDAQQHKTLELVENKCLAISSKLQAIDDAFKDPDGFKVLQEILRSFADKITADAKERAAYEMLRNSCSVLKQERDCAMTDKAQAESQYIKIQSDLHDLQRTLAEKEAEIQGKKSEMTILQGEIAATKAEYVKLQNSMTELIASKEKMQRLQVINSLMIPDFLKKLPMIADLDADLVIADDKLALTALKFRSSLSCLINPPEDLNQALFHYQLMALGKALNDYLRVKNQKEDQILSTTLSMLNVLNEFFQNQLQLFLPALGGSFQTNRVESVSGQIQVAGVLNWGLIDQAGNIHHKAKVL